jgi:Protein of unknown function (DUF3048) N-terminal domain/Protein of unknown function (DUF3048) C-terminal domain
VSTRGRWLTGALAVIVLAVGGYIGFQLLTKEPGESLAQAIVPDFVDPGPTLCPYTGVEAPDEATAVRPAIAVKVENAPESRPQAGLGEADVVYEVEAEGGITRFMVVFQCQDADRIGPVRSARPVDQNLLTQLHNPLFAYAGGVAGLKERIASLGVVDLNYIDAVEAYTEDPARVAPHQFFTSTAALYDAAGKKGGEPEPLFTFDDELDRDGTKKAKTIHTNFSSVADVFWTYMRQDNVYVRAHGTEPHTLEDGSQVSATNVVVMMVKRLPTNITDPAGNPVPNYDIVGSGKAFVFRGGRAISGRWERDGKSDLTTFVGADGEEIPLAPGRTWVTLFPTDAEEPLAFE